MNQLPTNELQDEVSELRPQERLIGSPDGLSGSAQPFLSQRQHANALIMVTNDAGLSAEIEITNGGLLSVAALVSSILLSTAVLVHVATRNTKSKKLW
ncbi:hypothetical protein [Agrobacterium vitis]|uniref:hypothetical protein n=1 Tax=Agrobacterium vitis TaxID=373 RepID=UPI0015733EEE|nr:hypothetical protein [Agrobacterium vitis]NSY14791.1 hypothetical protein [Agrobacterium vitis]NSY24548.1 hypothetical protein [Agrobacterium vitis]WEO75454.1 hypothetical protein G6L01_026480 [Agrobacterium vitis]